MAKKESKKKDKKGISINLQLFFVSLTVLALIILLGLFVIYSINRIKDINANYAIILSMDDCVKKMSDSESIFLLKESSQEGFYLDKNVSSVVAFKGNAGKLNSLFKEFSTESKNFKQLNKSAVDSLGKMTATYENLFDSLLILTQAKGFKDYGLIGNLNSVAQNLENTISNQNIESLHLQILELLQNEKDYLIKKDPAYFERFKYKAETISTLVDSFITDDYIREQIITGLDEYQNLFKQLLDYDNKIGLTRSSGIIASLESTKNQIAGLNGSFIQKFSTSQEKELKQVKIRFFIVVALVTLALLLIVRRISNNISVPFDSIKNSLEPLSIGVIPENLTENKSSKEIRELARILNKIIYGFKNNIQYAKNLKDGNFDEEYEPLSEKDELGNALLDMKNGLMAAEKEREKQRIEEKKQTWINKGSVEFGELLNQNYTDTEDFTYSIISKLVKYLDANQGGFFVAKKDDAGEAYLELASAIAYDRRKFVDKRIEMGEGLVGSCVMENHIYYRTEIPEEYITITSGLGGSNPKVLLIVPLIIETEIYGAIEIASFNELEDYKIEFVKTISETITNTMSSVRSREETQLLLDQSQAQSEQIIQAEEEMRQNLEEMQATQEESARREEKLKEELDEAHKKIESLEDQINKFIRKNEN